jgi:DNA-binding PadR family transcriptional regulator
MLLVLAEQPLSGYGLMQEIESRSEGVWRPSPGSVYPALAQLEDEGLVRVEEDDGRKRYVLTDDGKAYVDEHRDELGEPWAGLGDEVGEGRMELRSQIGQVATAVHQVAAAGTDEQIEQARKVLEEARRSLYRILAEE